MKKKVIVVILVLIIAIGALGFLYLKTDRLDVLKTPEKLFFEQLSKNSENVDNYDQFLNYVKRLESEKYSNETVITGNIKSDNISITAISAMLEKAKITLKEESNFEKQESYSNILVDYDNKNVIDAKVIQNEELIGIKIEDFLTKYLAIENSNLKALAERFEMDSSTIPNKLETIKTSEILDINKEERQRIINRYLEVIKSQISADKYSEEKNIETTINENLVKTNVYKLQLSGSDINNILVKTLESVRDDDETFKLIEEKMNIIYPNGIDGTSVKEVIIQLKTGITYVLEKIKENPITDGMTLKLYSYNDKLSKIEILVGSESISLEILNSTDTTISYVITPTFENMQDIEKITVDVTTSGKLDSNEIKESCNFGIVGKNNYLGTKINFAINSNIKFNTDLSIENITDNSLVINDLTDDEILNLVDNIQIKGQEFLVNKAEIFGINEEIVTSLFTTGI